ncbi:Putative major facilitator superfamily, MFS transporter superfamily [Colletotrichum destructivum]|uniref:Major facilitator superfamily, MFS transporter superfamily n=1 Tax=Colletotrichum destructivum TaxID=34406 RepID=A0AAX4IC98_9PEZI|nr:Putative major facilitator superfamily, MFS transporter superfamily [Colletotrichum destructivum]
MSAKMDNSTKEITVEVVSHGSAISTDGGDHKAESRIRLKTDLCVIPLAALIFMFCFIDRSNIGNARLAGLERDLSLVGYDFNSVNTIFYVSYIVFEIPSNVLCKIVGPGWYLPGLTVLFGLLTVASAYVNNYSQLAACRFLLGIAEAGIMPGLSYYLSRFYTHSELTFRLSLYIVMGPLAGAFGGLLASAILRLQGFGARIPAGSWRAIFAVEGILTVAVGLLSLVILTDRPETARFLSLEEREIAANRLKEERIGTTVILDTISKTKMIKGAINPVTATTSICFMFCSLSIQGLALFAPTIVRSIYPDASVTRQQLLTVPPYAFGAVCLLSMCFASWKLNRRQVFMTTARYAAVFLMASTSFILGPLCHSQASANVSSDTARNMSIAICMFFGNIGSLVSTWSFLPSDAPNYPIGCGLNLATSTLIMVTAAGTWVWMRRDNSRRDQKNVDAELASLNSEEAEQLEWKHPAFRWRL